MENESPHANDPWQAGQEVKIIGGPFNGFEGVIRILDRKARMATVTVNFFTRPTPVEVPFAFLAPPDKKRK